MANPPHAPTPESRAQVSALYSYGITQEEIARFLSIDPKTLRLHYRDELDSAHVKANAKVGQFLFQNASGATLKDGATHSDCVRAAMFWAKTRMGWRETNQVDLTSSDGSMATRGIDPAKLSTSALAELLAAADEPSTD